MIIIEMFLEQYISILDWFVKDHVKTEVMMPNIQLRITGINYILQYIQTESSYLNCNNILHNLCFYSICMHWWAEAH